MELENFQKYQLQLSTQQQQQSSLIQPQQQSPSLYSCVPGEKFIKIF